MPVDIHSYIRTLAVRHGIVREHDDVHGAEQAIRALKAEMTDLTGFLARARALEAFVRTVNPDAAQRAYGPALTPEALAKIAEAARAEHSDGNDPAHRRKGNGENAKSTSKRSPKRRRNRK